MSSQSRCPCCITNNKYQVYPMSDRVFNFHDLCLVITIVECLLLALYRLAIPSNRYIDSVMLGAFLLFVALDSTSALIMWNPYFPVSEGFREYGLPFLYIVSQLVRGPLFFLYVQALTDASFHIRRRHAWHFAPALIGLILLVAFSVTTSDIQMRSGEQPTLLVTHVLRYGVNLVSIVYALAALIAIHHYYQRLQDKYSNISTVEISWLMVLAGSFLLSWSWSLAIICVADVVGGAVADVFGTAHNYLRFLLLNGLFLYSLLYTHRMLAWQPEAQVHSANEPVTSEALAKIQQGIKAQKLHLEPNINIEEFSARVNLPVKTVSHALNSELGTKFFEFVNYHRVEEAKRLLADEAMAQHTVLEILMMAGFNNKSSFHRFFKRMVGMSPTEYRRSVKKASKVIDTNQPAPALDNGPRSVGKV